VPVDEDHPCRPDDWYSASKLAGEHLVACQSRNGPLSAFALREVLVIVSVLAMFVASAVAIVYTAAVSFVILVVVKKLVGLRVSEQEEILGLDEIDHGESAYND